VRGWAEGREVRSVEQDARDLLPPLEKASSQIINDGGSFGRCRHNPNIQSVDDRFELDLQQA
jgi:hypothetical protein